jgi:hypothetical protein
MPTLEDTSDNTYDAGWSLDDDEEEEEEVPLAPGA